MEEIWGENDKPVQQTAAQKVPATQPRANEEPWGQGDAMVNGKGIGGHIKDLGLGLAKGVLGIPEAAVGMADIATGGRVGQFLENKGGSVGFRPNEWKQSLTEMQTPQSREQMRQFDQADGILEKSKVALTNPSMVAGAVVESLPGMVAGGYIGRGALAAGRGLGAVTNPTNASRAAAQASSAGAIGEGAMMAGQQASEIRQKTEDGLLTPGQAGAALATGVAGGAISALGGRVAQKLGIGDADTMLVQGRKGVSDQLAREAADAAANPLVQQAAVKGIPKQIIQGAISEGLLEELPQSVAEQVIQNLALDKPWHDGVDAAVVLGTLTGGAMGGAAAGYRGFMTPDQRAAQQGATQVVPGQQPDQQTTAVTPGLDRVRAAYEAQLQALQDQEQGDAQVQQSVPPDGAAALAQQRAAAEDRRQADIAASRAVESPDDEILQSTGAADLAPSARMGIDPSAGPLSAGAAIAVDSGLTDQMQRTAALAQAAATGKGDKTAQQDLQDQQPEQKKEQASQTGRRVHPETVAERGEQTATKKSLISAKGQANGPQADQTQQASAQQAQGRAAPAVQPATGLTNASTSTENLGAQAAPAQSPQGQTQSESRQQRAQRVADAGQVWTRMPFAERASLAGRTDLKPIVKKNLAHAQWDAINGDIQRKLADSMRPAAQAAGEEKRFAPETGTLGIPRAEMPQIPTASHGGLVRHLNAQGIAHETKTLDAAELKPTQAEYSPSKVEDAKSAEGDRAVIVSNDGHIIDGHHQAIAAAEEGKQVKAIVLDAPVAQALEAVKASPSAKPGPKAKAAARQKAVSNYFTPGNIVRSYGGGFDRVLSFTAPDANGSWSVRVQAVEREGEGWRDVEGNGPRTHTTEPSARELAAGPSQAATTESAVQELGPFGPILTQYRHDAQGAIKALTALQDGEAVAALHHPEVGDIDLVWGRAGTGNKDGYGLSKLVQFHPEVLGDLQGFLSRLHKDQKRSGPNRIRLVDDSGEAAVSLNWKGDSKVWLLTAYDKGAESGTTMNTAGSEPKDDTTRLGLNAAQSVNPPAADSNTTASIFTGLESRGGKKKTAQQAAKEHPNSALIAQVQDQFYDILIHLMESGRLAVNGATTLTEDNKSCL